MPLANDHNEQDTYDIVQEDGESGVGESHTTEHQSSNVQNHQNEKQDELPEEEQNHKLQPLQPIDQNFIPQFVNFPSQYPQFINPNVQPYLMPTGGPIAPAFIPFNYLASPTNQNQIKPNQIFLPSNQPVPVPNGVNGLLPQVHDSPINPLNSFNSQFSNGPLPFYGPNGLRPFNYMNPSYGFNGANPFPFPFEQTNPFANFYGNNFKRITASEKQNEAIDVKNSPFAIDQSMNHKFNGFPEYFAKTSSTGN